MARVLPRAGRDFEQHQSSGRGTARADREGSHTINSVQFLEDDIVVGTGSASAGNA